MSVNFFLVAPFPDHYRSLPTLYLLIKVSMVHVILTSLDFHHYVNMSSQLYRVYLDKNWRYFCRNTVLFTNFIFKVLFSSISKKWKSVFQFCFIFYHHKGYEYVALDLALRSVWNSNVTTPNCPCLMSMLNATDVTQAKISAGAHVSSTFRRVLHHVTCKCHLCEMNNFWN